MSKEDLESWLDIIQDAGLIIHDNGSIDLNAAERMFASVRDSGLCFGDLYQVLSSFHYLSCT